MMRLDVFTAATPVSLLKVELAHLADVAMGRLCQLRCATVSPFCSQVPAKPARFRVILGAYGLIVSVWAVDLVNGRDEQGIQLEQALQIARELIR